MVHTIQNDDLTVSVAEKGAELQSIRDAAGNEYLWQGDPAYWTDRALNLFPYVARLTRETYRMDGKEYHMGIHGFTRHSQFALVKNSGTAMTLELCSSPETLEMYPREFAFRLHYQLDGPTLLIAYEVENRDEKTMYFGLGGHPGFQVPFAGGQFEDYRLRFSQPCHPRRVGFTSACFLDGTSTPFPLENDQFLPLRHGLFDQDAIVLKDAAREVTIERPGAPVSITVSFPRMPYVGFWHKPKTDAPYVCVEPWMSLPSAQDQVAVFEEQADLISVAPGGVYRNDWSIRVAR